MAIGGPGPVLCAEPRGRNRCERWSIRPGTRPDLLASSRIAKGIGGGGSGYSGQHAAVGSRGNRDKHTLSMESGQRLWLLSINGKRIEGTLTIDGNVVFRRMTLTKSD